MIIINIATSIPSSTPSQIPTGIPTGMPTISPTDPTRSPTHNPTDHPADETTRLEIEMSTDTPATTKDGIISNYFTTINVLFTLSMIIGSLFI